MPNYKMSLLCCGGTGCRASESVRIVERLREEIAAAGMDNDVQVVVTGCFGFCEKGPIVKVIPDNTFYTNVKPEDAEEIVKEHVVKGRKVTRLLYEDPDTKKHISDSKHMGFYQKQLRIALRNCGFINPENIDEYIARDGYEALAKVLQGTPQEAIETVKKSGLRGRGGGGFPTGLKWEIASKSPGPEKYVVCNADEGDPGAFMDRSILESDPNSVIEAMAICGYCIGASKGLVYIRAEYPLAVKRLQIAMKQARDYGLLGDDILGSGFNFDIEIRYGAGAFVCGEETALIHSMEGKRGEPTVKPPFPAESGYLGKPTNVNNVETFANIPVIFLKGPEWFASIGTEKSKGTKVFALAGKINNVGLIEVPMGTTLREVIYDIGGGIKGGSMMGSGGMIVMDEDDCMVSVAKFYLQFTVDESCGKCAPCRIGNKRLEEILDKITKGKGTMEDLDYLKNLSKVIKDTALCGLGQTSPNPVLSTLDNFYDEYVAHIVDKRCPAHKCRALRVYAIDPDRCKGCTACARACPAGAIKGEVKQAHVIDNEKCIRCGACFDKCKFNAVIVQ